MATCRRSCNCRFAVFTFAQCTTGGNVQSLYVLTFKADTGAQYRLKRLELVGITAFSKEFIDELLPMHTGDVFDGTAMRRLVASLKSLCIPKGFNNSQFIPSLEIDDAAKEISVTVTVLEGSSS